MDIINQATQEERTRCKRVVSDYIRQITSRRNEAEEDYRRALQEGRLADQYNLKKEFLDDILSDLGLVLTEIDEPEIQEITKPRCKSVSWKNTRCILHEGHEDEHLDAASSIWPDLS